MKNKLLVIGIIMSIIFILFLIYNFKHDNKFYLEDNCYGGKDQEEVDIDTFYSLIEQQKSFAIFIYQPSCMTSYEFENVLQEFQDDSQINLYQISFSKIRTTKLGNLIKYYPSFIIFNKGMIVDYLSADKEEDLKCYVSKSEFTNWFTKYVKLKDIHTE